MPLVFIACSIKISTMVCAHASVVSAPKLETLGCLSDGFYISGQDDLPRIVFGSTVIQVPLAFLLVAFRRLLCI
jgi:hypothetical protein